MQKSFSIISLSMLILIILSGSCNKEEGPGGTSTITGKVVERQYNANFTVLIKQFYAQDEDVFIIYGDDDVYGDKVSTNYDGTYKFEYLREGTYTIFAYSEDSVNYPTPMLVPVIRKVNITGKNQTVTVDNIIILK